ncbi:tRNA/rRNA methyltransferase (SpoU) [Kribbella flavida DSM 17836]|uniref:tRNA/rRNA methyltransferase (SpoU) n=1 Tax=Kribbella flavida (strain DSM 17836 / JCM 10339 / NBRC 14399) TaxID=479435 RepID=D2PVG0_KRIFD|nr:RNA methyltransferase [Kribbella flavida]ADB35200.1 tRNA/rRNA methyltransferase (SpoU) [Kribbella flavida DSM 17836]
MATRVSSRNARFQVWQALLSNRNKRQRAGEFLVQGVRPISLAVEHGWTVNTLIHDAERPLSQWARDLLQNQQSTERVLMAPGLLAELTEKDEAEILAVVAMPPDDLERIEAGPDFLGVVFDRPTGPGNIGSIIRSADAFGADGLIVTGHAADVYDPKAVRASTGSLFALPAVRVPSQREVMEWVAARRAAGVPIVVVGTDEHGAVDVYDFDFTQPTLLLVGNETTGLSAAWKELADELVRIPMTGAASSLNAANAATAVLYEASRQRGQAVKTAAAGPV